MKLQLKMPSEATASLSRATRETLRPPPNVKVSDWSKQNRFLSRKDSAKPGRWKSEPHQDAIMDAFVDPAVRRVVVKAASQLVGKSQMMNNIIGYHADIDPSNMMIVHPSDKAAEKWAKGRLDPLIEETPCLRGKFPPRKSRDSDNTILHRQFKGGQMFIVGVNAPADLSAQSVRIVLADEVDRYPTGSGQGDRDEGDPLDLAEQRTETYGAFAKIGYFSTPLIEGLSRIDAAYRESDQQEWELQCPHCDGFFAPLWAHVRWDKNERTGRIDLETVALWCPCCGVRWSEGDRIRAVEAGRFDAKAEFDGTRGFHINALGCRRADLKKLARQWEKAQGNPQRIKAFINLKLAECWKESGEAPEWERLRDRREPWPENRVPRDVLFLTIGVDTQGDRLEARVWGWTRDKRRYLIQRKIIDGDLYDQTEVGPWARLKKFISGTWQHESGAFLSAVRVAIDSGGNHTVRVYQWVKQQNPRQVMAVKGDSHAAGTVFRTAKSAETNKAGKAIKTGIRPWLVNSDLLKGHLYGCLKLKGPSDGEPHPPGWVHLPTWADDEELKQLTAEQLVTVKGRGGFPHREWQKLRPNEALDCAVYAHAAAIAFGLDRFNDRHWRDLEESLGVKRRDDVDAHVDEGVEKPARPPADQPPRPRIEMRGRRRVSHSSFQA